MSPNDDNLIEYSRRITTKEDFVAFLKMLLDDYLKCGNTWENPTLERYLEAMWAWADSMEGYYRNMHMSVDVDKPTWAIVADLFLAARVYE